MTPEEHRIIVDAIHDSTTVIHKGRRMIEHIEHYLKQHHCRDYFNSYGETVEDDHYFMYRDEIDGLIELVVRECVKVMYDNAIERKVPPDINQTPTHYAIAVLEHFGVEK